MDNRTDDELRMISGVFLGESKFFGRNAK